MREITKISLIISLLIACLPCQIHAANINFDKKQIENDHAVIELNWTEYGYTFVSVEFNNKNEKATSNYSLMGNNEAQVIVRMSKETGEKIYFERVGNIGYFYIDGILRAISEYGIGSNSRTIVQIPSSIQNLGIAPADKFSTFYHSGSVDWVAREIEDMIYDEAIDFLVATFIGGLPSYIALLTRDTYEMITELYDYCTFYDNFTNKDLHLVTVFYGSYHKECNILGWYGTKIYSLKRGSLTDIDVGSGQVFKKNPRHTWIVTPYDYSQPAACRLLVNQYP